MMSNISQIQSDPGRIRVLHRLWSDDLILLSSSRLRHASHGSLATYRHESGILCVKWDDYEEEVFVEAGEVFVDVRLHREFVIDLKVTQAAAIDDYRSSVSSIVINIPETDHLVELRPGSSDIDVFRAIFFAGEYNRPDLPFPVKTIIDLGANIGLSTIFYALRYSNASIIAVEPEGKNFRLLSRNLLPFVRTVPVHAAAWSSDTSLKIQDMSSFGKPIDHWAYRVELDTGAEHGSVCGITISSLMEKYAIETIDILKVDIEGSEFEIFDNRIDAWLPRTKCIVIETHDRFRPGSDQLVTSKLLADYHEYEPNGENRIFVRKSLHL